MNPTLNKSDFEDLTTSLKDLAYSYLEKYSPSKQQLKVYLLKKYLTKINRFRSYLSDKMNQLNDEFPASSWYLKNWIQDRNINGQQPCN